MSQSPVNESPLAIVTGINSKPGLPTLYIAKLAPVDRLLANYNLISVSKIDHKTAIKNLKNKLKKLNMSFKIYIA
jgi:hypothetical protein